VLLLATAWLGFDVLRSVADCVKWARFPFLMRVLLPYLVAEETLLGPVEGGKKGRRSGAYFVITGHRPGGALMAGVLILHNGEIFYGPAGAVYGTVQFATAGDMDIVPY